MSSYVRLLGACAIAAGVVRRRKERIYIGSCRGVARHEGRSFHPVAMVKAKVAATAQKTFLDLQRLRQIRDLTRKIASRYQGVPVGYQKVDAEDNSQQVQAEVEMLRAELEYREAYSQLQRVTDGR